MVRACLTGACGFKPYIPHRQVMTFSVAMNSARGHALVALLIASNFVEIKGAPVSSGCRRSACYVWCAGASCASLPEAGSY